MHTATLARWVLLTASLVGASALAQNDIRISILGNPLEERAHHANFKAFAKSFAAALTSVNLTPPDTLGHAAWSATVELGVVHLNGVTPVDNDGDGNPDVPLPEDGSRFYMPTDRPGFENRSPLLLPSVHLRKGLPFSFELGTRFAWVDKSSIFAGTFEVKWAATEGFAYLPDIGVRLYGTRAFNTRDFEVGAGGFDLGVGKTFAVGGMITLTPYTGWNLVFVSARTPKPIDFDPTRSYAESVATPEAQLENTATYEALRPFENSHNRFYVGTRFIGGVVQIAAELSYSALGQISFTTSTGVTGNRPLPGVLATSVTLGLDY